MGDHDSFGMFIIWFVIGVLIFGIFKFLLVDLPSAIAEGVVRITGRKKA